MVKERMWAESLREFAHECMDEGYQQKGLFWGVEDSQSNWSLSVDDII
jgi:hypothetical protein